MKIFMLVLGGALVSLLLSGCASKITSANQYSGFLSSYEGLAETRTPSGSTVLRWTDPRVKISDYDNLIYNPIGFYPQPSPSERVSQQTLQDLLEYTNRRVSSSLAQRLRLVSVPGPRTLSFRGAITALDASNQGLKPYEVVPFAMIAAGALTAAGQRDQNTELYLEAELIDTATGKPVLRVARKGLGKTLENEKQVITLDDLRSVIDDMTQDILRFP